jgi:predicted methyltransferase
MAEITPQKKPLDINTDFSKLVEIKEGQETSEADAAILFYCRDCKDFREVLKHQKKLSFACKVCKGKNIAFGTKQSLKNFYRIS